MTIFWPNENVRLQNIDFHKYIVTYSHITEPNGFTPLISCYFLLSISLLFPFSSTTSTQFRFFQISDGQNNKVCFIWRFVFIALPCLFMLNSSFLLLPNNIPLSEYITVYFSICLLTDISGAFKFEQLWILLLQTSICIFFCGHILNFFVWTNC